MSWYSLTGITFGLFGTLHFGLEYLLTAKRLMRSRELSKSISRNRCLRACREGATQLKQDSQNMSNNLISMCHDVPLMKFSLPIIVKYLRLICTTDRQSLGIFIYTIHELVSDHVSMADYPHRQPSLLAWRFYLAAFLKSGKIIMIQGRKV